MRQIRWLSYDAALRDRGTARGRSGFNVWVEVPDEAAVVGGLLQLGWVVAPGARYRVHSPAAIRVTCAALAEEDAARFALSHATAHLRHRAAFTPRRGR